MEKMVHWHNEHIYLIHSLSVYFAFLDWDFSVDYKILIKKIWNDPTRKNVTKGFDSGFLVIYSSLSCSMIATMCQTFSTLIYHLMIQINDDLFFLLLFFGQDLDLQVSIQFVHFMKEIGKNPRILMMTR